MNIELLDLVLGNLGTLVVLALLAFAFYKGWIVPGFVYREALERLTKVDAQTDTLLDLVKQVLARMDLQDERERIRREEK